MSARQSSRYLAFLLVLILSAPVATSALLDPAARDEASRAIRRAMEQATSRYRSGKEVVARKEAGERQLIAKELRLREIAKKKRDVRMQIVAIRKAIVFLQEEHGIDVSDPAQAQVVLDDEREKLRSFVRYLHGQRVVREEAGPDTGEVVVSRMLFASLGDRVDDMLREEALQGARNELLMMVLDAQDLPVTLAALTDRHQDLVDEYHRVLEERDTVAYDVELSTEQLEEIKRTVAEVQMQIMNMQTDLARIDAKLRNRASRTLIEMGLIDPVPGQHSTGTVGGDGLSWPVYGGISAGYMESSYKRHFGVPHYGIDILAPQHTAVRAAADGIVYVARDSGYGYSYILIGHRDGYATLYGHISQIQVSAGQQVRKGEVIGLSGGAPGTPGAGLMTTGSHLHFEVIKDGVHVNPLGVLP